MERRVVEERESGAKEPIGTLLEGGKVLHVKGQPLPTLLESRSEHSSKRKAEAEVP